MHKTFLMRRETGIHYVTDWEDKIKYVSEQPGIRVEKLKHRQNLAGT